MMKRSIFLLSLLLWQLTLLLGQVPTQDQRIESLLEHLSLEEKVKLCHAQSKFTSAGVPRLGIPELMMSDGPHGIREEIQWDSWAPAGWTSDSCTAFPSLTCLAATFNPDLAFKYGVAIGEEARYRRKDVLLGPGVNIYRTPLNGRNFEYMGEDPYLASSLVVPYVQGVQRNGVAACVKHFALNNQEKWRKNINVKVSDRALYEIYLPAFKAAVQEGEAWSIMGAYNKFNGQHTTHHERLNNKILKGEWQFDGVVISDWGSTHHTLESAYNGLDIEMGTRTDGFSSSQSRAYDHYYLANPFLEMLKKGEIDVSVLDDKVRRILRLMLRTTMNTSRGLGKMNSSDHFEVARQVGSEGIVLLKNDGGFFPISPDKPLSIAVIGENATRKMTKGGGSSQLKTIHEISPLEGIRQSYPNAEITYAKGYASGAPVYNKVLPSGLDADSLHAAAVALAARADVVLFVGGLNKNRFQDCENGDRQTYHLPFGQDELIQDIAAVNQRVGVLLVGGNAVAMPWVDQVQGIMHLWYLGSEAGYALADVLSGKTNPSGKLPISFPVKLEDNAAHAFDASVYPGDGKDVWYKEGILVGYRWHDTQKIAPLFEFGYGLSYTTFDLLSTTTDKRSYAKDEHIRLSCVIENTGMRSGSQVIQVYVHDKKSKVMRPLQELKGYHKIEVMPKQSQKVQIEIDVSDLAFYDESLSDWNVEAGSYELRIGFSSRDIRQTVKIQVQE